ncbi:tyrosine-type recombinase/integrase [Pseudonocardia broussonetiae]|uniref:Tyrosine-type recombinase/integrase n=1 Tax=Pseudonocardia broussonetiae TaxID=2736640 RepID=A0A6M6JI91_9PSEU|nr:site-specific integrase [Pseudonocardia broussonetiae]QJY46627.1 tyrosine-type recombinase/integrase [Pseudonocardia broussonetiae]
MIRLHVDWLRRTGATDRTVYHRRENLRRYAERIDVELLDATHDDIDRWQAGLRVSLSSVRTYTNHIASFYRWAVDAGHLDTDPAVRIPRPKIPARAARPVPEKDYALLLDAAPEPVRTWLLLAGFMGLRAHEIAQMRREDITERGGRMYLSGVGKGQKSFLLAVPREVEPFLAAHLRTRPGPVWATIRGGRVSAKYVTNTVTALMRAVELPYTLHCLRHRFGTALWGQTRDLLVVQQAMRHANPNTTRLYVATADGEATAAMDRLSSTLRPKRGSRPPRPRREAA